MYSMHMGRSFVLAVLLSNVMPALANDQRPIEIHVDGTEAPRRLFRASLVIPAKPGPLTLYYPKWIQGEHQPSGPVIDLSGVKLSAGGRSIPWQRDEDDLYSFHCTVPEGVNTIEASLEYLIPGEGGGYGAGPAVSARLAILNWYLVTVYPKGPPVREIQVRAKLTLPSGWQVGTALPVENHRDNVTQFATVSLETFADSPALCGEYFKEVPLGPKNGPPHYLVMACDSPTGLEIGSTLQRHYERLVLEAGALFGARHYRSYRFLMAMTEQISHNAIEHHESSDNRLPERMMLDDNCRKIWTAWVLPHEFVHSWNGKYRRPDGLVQPDFQRPMRTRMLWVYEGLTEYLGFVLAARSGLYTPEMSRDNLAMIADWAKNQGGRDWRPLVDTTIAAPHLYRARKEWDSRRRGVDFYDEGALIWLDADTLIREKTDGKKSLDDFCRNFFGGTDGPPQVRPYSYDDIVSALNDVLPFDWRTFLDRRLNVPNTDAPLEGIGRGGWKLTYKKNRSDLLKANDEHEKQISLTSSLGLLIKEDGKIIDVIPGSAADKAGLGPHMKIHAVNGRRFNAERIRETIAATATGESNLRILAENGDFFKEYHLDYHGGERYPHLERVSAQPDRISDIFRPKAEN